MLLKGSLKPRKYIDKESRCIKNNIIIALYNLLFRHNPVHICIP